MAKDQIPGPVFDPFRDVDEAQKRTREGVIAQGELLRPELMGRIGDTLGGLNSIGGLRSGGTKVALDDINRDFTDRIGNIASAATTGAIGQGLQAGNLRQGNQQLQFQKDEASRKRKAALLGAIGSVVGAGIGFAVGGPLGAVAGAKVVSGGGTLPRGSDGRISGGFTPPDFYGG